MENNTTTTLGIGSKVERIGSSKDYTTGRTGEIVEVSGDRFRVKWLYERSGSLVNHTNPANGLRTWVNKKFLRLIAEYPTPAPKPAVIAERDPLNLGGTGHGDESYSDADPGL